MFGAWRAGHSAQQAKRSRAGRPAGGNAAWLLLAGGRGGVVWRWGWVTFRPGARSLIIEAATDDELRHYAVCYRLDPSPPAKRLRIRLSDLQKNGSSVICLDADRSVRCGEGELLDKAHNRRNIGAITCPDGIA